jgi:plasmid maintenance system antidote protein VapI
VFIYVLILFWINLQSRYDLAVVEQNIGAKVIAEVEQAAV